MSDSLATIIQDIQISKLGTKFKQIELSNINKNNIQHIYHIRQSINSITSYIEQLKRNLNDIECSIISINTNDKIHNKNQLAQINQGM